MKGQESVDSFKKKVYIMPASGVEIMGIKDSMKIMILTVALTYLLAPQKVFAAFSLSVRPDPYLGSDDLRFETINPTGEPMSEVLKIEVTSDIGRYELTQNLLTPLTNSALGVSMPDDNFIFYARGRATYGILNYIEQDTPVRGLKNIYTSNDQGTSDYFELVYAIKTPLGIPAGLYNGRIAFVLNPIGSSTQTQIIKTLNIIAQVGMGESAIEITTATGTKIITLNSAKENMGSFDVLVNVKGRVGSQFRILQLLPEPVRSTEGEELSYEAVNYVVGEAKKGIAPSQATLLSNRMDEVYKSGLQGESESFIITYSLGDLFQQKAGRYKTNIQYRLEGTGGFIKEGLIETLGLEVEIERKFDLAVKTELGTGMIEFRDLKPTQPPRTYEVSLEVNTNIAKPYQVTQNVYSELTSKEGEVMPTKYFTLRTEGLDTKGALKFPQQTEVKKGDTVLFVSDNKGNPDKFKVIYELTPPRDVKAGNYSTNITYSLSEI